MHLIDEIYGVRKDPYGYKLDVDFLVQNFEKYDHEPFYEVIDTLVTIIRNQDDILDPFDTFSFINDGDEFWVFIHPWELYTAGLILQAYVREEEKVFIKDRVGKYLRELVRRMRVPSYFE